MLKIIATTVSEKLCVETLQTKIAKGDPLLNVRVSMWYRKGIDV